MRRRDFIKGIVGSATSWPFATRAQQPTMPVIGFVNAGSANDLVAINIGEGVGYDDEATVCALAERRQGLQAAAHASSWQAPNAIRPDYSKPSNSSTALNART
jgi:hypothetical protein